MQPSGGNDLLAAQFSTTKKTKYMQIETIESPKMQPQNSGRKEYDDADENENEFYAKFNGGEKSTNENEDEEDQERIMLLKKFANEEAEEEEKGAKSAEEEEPAPPCREQPFFGHFRYCIALLCALALFNSTSMRMNLSMAMVCMVNSTAVHLREKQMSHSSAESPAEGAQRPSFSASTPTAAAHQQAGLTSSPLTLTSFGAGSKKTTVRGSTLAGGGGGGGEEDECSSGAKQRQREEGQQKNAGEIAREMGYQGTLEWSTGEQARLFSASFYGSFFTVWYSGYLADRFGPKLLLTLSILNFSLFSLLSPLLVHIHYIAFFVGRFLMGLGEGFMIPIVASAAGRWFLPTERSRMAALYTMGNQIAGFSTLLLSSRLCALDLLGGWPNIFLTFGIFGFLFLIVWNVFGANNPESSKWIGEPERKMILESQRGQNNSDSKRLKTTSIPWRLMLRSVPLYSGVFCQMNYSFTIGIISAYLPTFYKEIVKLNLKDNGDFSMIPFIAMVFGKILFGFLADFLRSRHYLSATGTVKLFQSIATFGGSLSFLCVAFFVNCNTPFLAGIFMALFGLSFGGCVAGFFTQLLSLAPRFSGTISSIGTGLGFIAYGTGPLMFSAINETGVLKEWQIIWCILAGLNIFFGLFFLIFASAEEQSWANWQPEEKKIEI